MAALANGILAAPLPRAHLDGAVTDGVLTDGGDGSLHEWPDALNNIKISRGTWPLTFGDEGDAAVGEPLLCDVGGVSRRPVLLKQEGLGAHEEFNGGDEFGENLVNVSARSDAAADEKRSGEPVAGDAAVGVYVVVGTPEFAS